MQVDGGFDEHMIAASAARCEENEPLLKEPAAASNIINCGPSEGTSTSIFTSGTSHWRLVDRDAPAYQSHGTMRIQRRHTHAISQFFRDSFHSILGIDTSRLILLLVCVYLFCVLVIAALFQTVEASCDLELKSFRDAFMLALETVATIGYGLPKPFMGSCSSGVVVLTVAVIVGMLLDTFFIGLLFARIGRGSTRAASITFSNKALIRRINGNWYFIARVCDSRKRPLVEAHVRMYAVLRGPKLPSNGPELTPRRVDSFVMRLQHPDDELGSTLLIDMPSSIVHRIDAWSPLGVLPKALRNPGSVDLPVAFPGLQRRAVDSEHDHRVLRSRSTSSSRRVMKASQKSGNSATASIMDDTSTVISDDNTLMTDSRNLTRAEIESHWAETSLEVVAVVEGIETLTSMTLQARHSYTLEDVAFGYGFGPCLYEDDAGRMVIDFNRFHDLVPVTDNEEK